MISKIQSITDFGVFRTFQSKDIKKFARYNLIYGWNGSGKTTLAKIFATLEKKEKPAEFPSGNFQILLQNEQILSSDNLSESALNIKVFHKNFVENNIDWERHGAKGILLISEENIEGKKLLTDVIKTINIKRKTFDNLKKEDSNFNKREGDFLSNTARDIKNSFKAIETQDSYYFNYDRSKIRKFIANYRDTIESGDGMLNEDDETAVRRAIKPESKPKIVFNNPLPKRDEILKVQNRIKELLSTKIITQSIAKLITNPDIARWIETGLKIHSHHNSQRCEFCGNQLESKRLKELEGHFSKEYEEIKERVQKAIDWLDGKDVNLLELPQEHDLYDELHLQFKEATKVAKTCIDALNFCLKTWKDQLADKRDNIFKIITIEETSIESALSDCENAIAQIEMVFEEHNKKTENFETELKRNKTALELHYVTQAVTENSFFDIEKQREHLRKQQSDISRELRSLEIEKKSKEAKLSDEALGASYFNDLLHRFIGRNDISVEFDEMNKGYNLIRSGAKKPAMNLSEGEKTAIAFVYFITKLHEQHNQMANTIVIVDDPVSSLDSNHLLHAFSFLRSETENALQLFVLTHNFLFFKMVRDWILPMNNHKTNLSLSECYVIKNSFKDSERYAEIENAKQSLITYNSEYHFLFQRVFDLMKMDEIDIDESYSIANLSRRLLESFLSFKFPIHRDFRQRIFKTNDFDEVKKDRIYNFIQKYSHSDRIESIESLADNLISEGHIIVKDILELMEHIDKNHFDEMKKLSSK